MNLAEIAVELRLATAPLAEVAFAAYLEVTIAEIVRRRLEETAARIGLEQETARRILDQYEERARLLEQAHKIIKALIPFQDDIEQLLELPEMVRVIVPSGADAPTHAPLTRPGF